jgi:hypothetical protein
MTQELQYVASHFQANVAAMKALSMDDFKYLYATNVSRTLVEQLDFEHLRYMMEARFEAAQLRGLSSHDIKYLKKQGFQNPQYDDWYALPRGWRAAAAHLGGKRDGFRTASDVSSSAPGGMIGDTTFSARHEKKREQTAQSSFSALFDAYYQTAISDAQYGITHADFFLDERETPESIRRTLLESGLVDGARHGQPRRGYDTVAGGHYYNPGSDAFQYPHRTVTDPGGPLT